MTRRRITDYLVLLFAFGSVCAIVIGFSIASDRHGVTIGTSAPMGEVEAAVGKTILAADRMPDNSIVLALDDGSTLTFRPAIVGRE